MIDAYRQAHARAGREGDGEIVLQGMLSWAPTEAEAFEAARKWKGAQPQDHYTAEWHEPRKMYEHGEAEVGDEQFADSVIATSDPEQIHERLREIERLEPTVVIVTNNSAAAPQRAIEVLGRDVLPALRKTRV